MSTLKEGVQKIRTLSTGQKEISKEIVDAVRNWLGTAGLAYFKSIHLKYGRVSACWVERHQGMPIPHAVHFHEGMRVRNFLRTLPECETWTAEDFDNNWENVILLCIE